MGRGAVFATDPVLAGIEHAGCLEDLLVGQVSLA